MKKIIFTLLTLTAAILLFANDTNGQNSSNSNLLRHIVIITFKQDAPADSIKALDNVYRDLSKSSFVKDFELGINVSARDTGVVKHVYVTTFASKEDMKNYSKIPEYAKLFKISLPISDDVTVVDYWVNK
ncbi:MAG TPA: Dabb family protein [Ginsengibacter sp.]|nr:Dabb family protein [Ginsengibacter sp.]